MIVKLISEAFKICLIQHFEADFLCFVLFTLLYLLAFPAAALSYYSCQLFFHFVFPTAALTLCIPETPKRVLLQIVKTQMKCSIMLTIFFFNLIPTPLEMHNGLFEVYCIKPEERIH